jgi:hypothetical protein
MKLLNQAYIKNCKRAIFYLIISILPLSVYANRPTQLHCLGNGSYCAFGQGADIESIFGPGYSSPSYLQLAVQDSDSIQSFRINGTAIWEHTLFKEGKVTARLTDFIDSEAAIFTRIVDCHIAFTIDLLIQDNEKITLVKDWYNRSINDAASLLIYKDRGLPIYGNYDHPNEQFQHIYAKGDVALEQKEHSLYRLRFKPGRSELFCIGGSTFQECEENSRLASITKSSRFLERTKNYWQNFTDRRINFEQLIPESFQLKKAVIEQIDNVAIILKTQQADQGSVIAGHRYHLGYVRDQYGVSRGFLAMGYFKEAKKILQFYWDIWQNFGYIRNAQAIGVPGIFHQHENDEVEITGYLIIQAFDYLYKTSDQNYLKEILPMLEWAWEVQKRHLIKGMLPFNGDETYVAGGILPRSALNDGSAEATLLFVESGKQLLEFVEKNQLWETAIIASNKEVIRETEAIYLQNFIHNRQIMANNPSRMTIEEMPPYRHGFCAGSHGVLETRKDEGGNYLCPKCISEGLSFPMIERKTFFLPSLALTPSYFGSTLIPKEILDFNLSTIKENYQHKGQVSSREDSDTTIGYEYGFFLYALAKERDKMADRILADMLSVVDETGAWVEYYHNGLPMGCNYRPWESAINIEAAIAYATNNEK